MTYIEQHAKCICGPINVINNHVVNSVLVILTIQPQMAIGASDHQAAHVQYIPWQIRLDYCAVFRYDYIVEFCGIFYIMIY